MMFCWMIEPLAFYVRQKFRFFLWIMYLHYRYMDELYRDNVVGI